MGFLDKLRLSGNDKEKPPQPPSIKEPTPPKDTNDTMQLDTPPPLKDMPPLDTPPSLNMPDEKEQEPQQSAEKPPELNLPEQPQEQPSEKASLLEQEPADEIPPLKPMVPQEESKEQNHASVPPPPAPQNKERSIRSVSDIPPIKLDASTDSKQGIITDHHVADLDVNKLVLPQQPTSIVKGPVQPEKELPDGTSPQELMSSAPALPKVAPQPQQPKQPSRPTPHPQQQPARPAPPQAKQQPAHAYTGPLYVDVPMYEEVQDHLSTLKKELEHVVNDVDTIQRLNKKEEEDFLSLVERLEGIQDRVLGIDKSLFEER